MGMYDTVVFRCPKCEERMEAQSRAGECSLHDYNHDSVPPEIANDIQGAQATCPGCDNVYMVVKRPESEVRVAMGLMYLH